MNKIENAYNELIKGIQQYIKKCIDNSGFDKTYTGIVKSKTQDGYTVMFNGQIYNDVQTLCGECNVNDSVKVVVPQNNFSNMFINVQGKRMKAEIIASTTFTSTNTTTTSNPITVPNLNQYDAIMLCCMYTNDTIVLSSEFIPIDVFKTGLVFWCDYNTSSYLVFARYLSDTSISCWRYNGNPSSCRVYGIKFN